MKAARLNSVEQVEKVFGRIQDLGLERHVAELDARGYTVVPPEVTGAGALTDALAERLLEVSQARLAQADAPNDQTYGNQTMHYMLNEGPLFEQAMMHPVPLALISYLLGDSCQLSSMVAMVKGPGTAALPLHVDNGPGVPEPLPPYAQVANATWVLSDYTVENGPLCFVPGSHHLCRHPSAGETDPRANPLVVPVEAPKGSLVVFHGNLFHGALPRTAPGLRLNLIMFFARLYFRPQEDYTSRVTPEMLSRNPERFADLLGLKHPFPADPVTGINARDVAAMGKSSYSIYA